MLKAILIDGEPECVQLLARELAVHCPQVQVVGKRRAARRACGWCKF